jgi:hypothetical protein
MLAGMTSHVDSFPGHPGRIQCTFHNTIRISHKSINGTVGGFSGINIKESAAICFADCFSNGLDGFLIAAFGKIRYTLDNFIAHINAIPILRP